MFVGLDVGKEWTVGVWKDAGGNKVREDRFPTRDVGLSALARGLDASSSIAVEASTHGIFVRDFLASRGLRVELANPLAVKWIYASDKKTDKADAEKLADLMRLGLLPVCYVPDARTRELRDVIRHRKALVEINASLKNKVRAILAREGLNLPYQDVLGVKSVEWLEGVEVSEVQGKALRKLVALGQRVKEDVTDYDGEVNREFENNPQAQLLATHPGVGAYAAVHIMSAIGDVNRFPSDEQLASYAGVVPKTWQSGNTTRTKGLKQGDKLLKWILVQCAHAAVRTRCKYRKLYLKKTRKTKSKQKAIIAVARKMVETMYCMLKRGEAYREQKPQ